jgi:hypothetical protein
MRSLHQFVDAAGPSVAVRLYAGALAVQACKTPGGTHYQLLNLPYFLASKLPEYLEWMGGPRRD